LAQYLQRGGHLGVRPSVSSGAFCMNGIVPAFLPTGNNTSDVELRGPKLAVGAGLIKPGDASAKLQFHLRSNNLLLKTDV